MEMLYVERAPATRVDKQPRGKRTRVEKRPRGKRTCAEAAGGFS